MKITRIILCLVVFAFFTAPVMGAEPAVQADGALLMDAETGDVLWEKSGREPMAPASLIKLLNVITAWPYILPDEEITVGSAVKSIYNGQLLNLQEGDVITAENLLHGILLWSANDGAVALADYLAGDQALYAALMDTKAWALGALHTKSINVNGYSDKDQFSTAYDLAVIAARFMEEAELAAIVATDEYEVHWVSREDTLAIWNTNKMIESYSGCNGIKTGTTSMAGKCLIASALREGRQLIAVVLNSSDRYGDAKAMLDWGFVQN